MPDLTNIHIGRVPMTRNVELLSQIAPETGQNERVQLQMEAMRADNVFRVVIALIEPRQQNQNHQGNRRVIVVIFNAGE